jgi:metal-responsive CopG/Arc/MetJ family transcriptional regulator
MTKISVHLDSKRLKELDELVENIPDLAKRNRSALLAQLIKQAASKHKREQMLEAAVALEELNLGWNEEEENCAIIDMEVSGW